MSYTDEYDYDFDHPACLKCGDKLMRFLIIESANNYAETQKTNIIGEMEFISQQLADDHCAELSRGGFYWYQAIPLNEEK